ncbi:uncharacterized protein CIMG_06384 [Coccidioides immitis RS]|uniref:Uncharacterized protein n=1 Tax=Coccidioides immitis (strain RS) TaxID=246410 RepID=J3K818_COCIM|nr:uncharacterized protein CIMG_06384 [Coccidioides immitis RS]EAS30905.3 hypothetical protein CIMG_06384 [Coccidioides immitis RS]
MFGVLDGLREAIRAEQQRQRVWTGSCPASPLERKAPPGDPLLSHRLADILARPFVPVGNLKPNALFRRQQSFLPVSKPSQEEKHTSKDTSLIGGVDLRQHPDHNAKISAFKGNKRLSKLILRTYQARSGITVTKIVGILGICLFQSAPPPEPFGPPNAAIRPQIESGCMHST